MDLVQRMTDPSPEKEVESDDTLLESGQSQESRVGA
jgi:hypothetical protein